MSWFKNNLGKFLLSVILVGLSIWHSTYFYVGALVYGMAMYLLWGASLKTNVRRFLSITVWIASVIIFGAGVYVNYWLPHGPSYSTGEIVCQNDERGPCGEQYKEDLRGLDIPIWAKFLRQSEGELLLLALLFAGIVISSKDKNLGEAKM